MPTQWSADRLEFARFERRAVVAGFDGGTITSDAGALLLGATDRAIGLVRRLAACFVDHRAPDRVKHGLTTLVGQRVLALALGYEDPVDHDALRHDPVLAAVARKPGARRSEYAALAGKSTLNRLEHALAGEPTRDHKIGHDGAAVGSFTAAMAALATGRSMWSAATACWRRSCAGRASTPAPALLRRPPGRWRGSAPAGPRRGSPCAPVPASRATR